MSSRKKGKTEIISWDSKALAFPYLRAICTGVSRSPTAIKITSERDQPPVDFQ